MAALATIGFRWQQTNTGLVFEKVCGKVLSATNDKSRMFREEGICHNWSMVFCKTHLGIGFLFLRLSNRFLLRPLNSISDFNEKRHLPKMVVGARNKSMTFDPSQINLDMRSQKDSIGQSDLF